MQKAVTEEKENSIKKNIDLTAFVRMGLAKIPYQEPKQTFQQWLEKQGFLRDKCGAWMKDNFYCTGKQLFDKLKEFKKLK